MLQTYKKYHLLQKPESIFVVTELKIAAYPHASAYIACNARGVPLAPFVVFHGDPVDASRLSAYSLPEFKDALFFNAKGAHDGDALFVWFRDHFRPSCCGRSVILFASCPVSEISLRLVQLAEEEHVALVSVPSSVAHLVQPLSSAVLHSLNDTVSAGIERLLTDGTSAQSGTLSHSLLAMLLAEVWADRWPTVDVREAFASCGIFPLNVRAISAERIAAASASDNASDSYTTNEAEDIDDDDDDDDDDVVTHGLNLLSELSTLEQQKDTCTERLAPQQRLNVSETVDDASMYRDAGSLRHRLRRPKSDVSGKVLKCFISGDKVNEISTHACPSVSRSTGCQSYVYTSGNGGDQFDNAPSNICDITEEHDTQHLVHATDGVKLSNYTSAAMTCRNNLHKIRRRDRCENSPALNHRRKNEATGVGRKVVATELTDFNQVRQKPSPLVNEHHDYNVPLNSNVDAPLHVIYCPSVGSSMPLNAEQDVGVRTEATQSDVDVPVETDTEHSYHHVCCEVVIY